MRLNLSLLSLESSFSSRDNRDSRDASNDAALSVPAVAGISRDEPGQDPEANPGRHLKTAPIPAVPAASRLSRDSETQQWRGLPAVPAIPVQKSNAGGNAIPAVVVGLLAANDCRHPGPLVLTFELDDGQATCIDPVSTSLADAVADIQRHFPGRVGRLWQHGKEVAA